MNVWEFVKSVCENAVQVSKHHHGGDNAPGGGGCCCDESPVFEGIIFVDTCLML